MIARRICDLGENEEVCPGCADSAKRDDGDPAQVERRGSTVGTCLPCVRSAGVLGHRTVWGLSRVKLSWGGGGGFQLVLRRKVPLGTLVTGGYFRP